MGNADDDSPLSSTPVSARKCIIVICDNDALNSHNYL